MSCALVSFGPGQLRVFNLDCCAANFLAHVREALAEEIAKVLQRSRQKCREAPGDALAGERLAAVAAEEVLIHQLLDCEAHLGSFDLVDATGERKFLGTRLEQRVSDFVGGDKLFYFARVADRTDSKSALQPVYLSAAALLPAEEAAKAVIPRAVEALRARGRK